MHSGMNVPCKHFTDGNQTQPCTHYVTLLLSIRQHLPPWLWALGSMGRPQPVCFGQQPRSCLGEESPAPSHHAEIYQQITG